MWCLMFELQRETNVSWCPITFNFPYSVSSFGGVFQIGRVSFLFQKLYSSFIFLVSKVSGRLSPADSKSPLPDFFFVTRKRPSSAGVPLCPEPPTIVSATPNASCEKFLPEYNLASSILRKTVVGVVGAVDRFDG